MERLRETVLRPPLGDRFSVPKVGATLTEFQVPSGTSSVGGPSGGTNFGGFGPFMFPTMMGGQGFPPFMGFGFPWMPAGFGAPGIGLSNLAGTPSLGGGGGTGPGDGGVSTDPTSGNYLPGWPQNNVFMAEILGWERAVAPPPTGDDPFKWIWKYKWREVQPNRVWPSHSVRTWDANPGVGVVYAYNGCEYPNWSAPADPEDIRRPFAGPFSFNFETASDDYLPFTVANATTPQGAQDYTLFTDFTGDGGGSWSDALPLWTEPTNPNSEFGRTPYMTLGQPLPIGHHGQAWSADFDVGIDQTTFAWSLNQGTPNVRVLMMEQWIKVTEGGLAGGGPEWCPDCDAVNNQTSIAFEDGNYVCTYWFYATNARFDLPWVPGRSDIPLNARLQVLAPQNQNDSLVPAYGWANP